MAGGFLSAGRALRKMPAARLLVAGELLHLARQHVARLEPQERKRALALVRRARGRPGNLTARERRELAALLQKAEPRVFMGAAVEKLTGVPLPSAKRRRQE